MLRICVRWWLTYCFEVESEYWRTWSWKWQGPVLNWEAIPWIVHLLPMNLTAGAQPCFIDVARVAVKHLRSRDASPDDYGVSCVLAAIVQNPTLLYNKPCNKAHGKEPKNIYCGEANRPESKYGVFRRHESHIKRWKRSVEYVWIGETSRIPQWSVPAATTTMLALVLNSSILAVMLIPVSDSKNNWVQTYHSCSKTVLNPRG